MFWDWARVNDRLIGGPDLNRNSLYKDLHPEHDFFVNWASDAKVLIDGVKSYLFSRGPSRTKLSWLTSPLPKEVWCHYTLFYQSLGEHCYYTMIDA